MSVATFAPSANGGWGQPDPAARRLPASAEAIHPDPSLHACVDVATFLRQLHCAGSVFEIRSLRCPVHPGASFTATAAGWFDDVERATQAIAMIDQCQPGGIYVSLNPCTPSLLARATNRIDFRAQSTTTDSDISHRRWIIADIDPIRAANISATAEEMEAALALARNIRAELSNSGWPTPLFGMSGNGAYLLYRVELANDTAAKELCRGVLRSLAERFDTAVAKVDQATFNAARIVKVLGTIARKGDDFRGGPGNPAGPHRASWLESAAADLLPVPFNLLETIAGAASTSRLTSTPTRSTPAETAAVGNHNAIERCRRYISRMPDAVSGQGGHNATFAAACECYRFGLNNAEALQVMNWFNATKTGGDQWSESELQHKLRDAHRHVEAALEIGVRLRNGTRSRPSRRPASGSEAATRPLEAARDVSASGDAQPIEGLTAGLPQIDIGCKNLATITTLTWEAIEAANSPPRWFRFGGQPSRIEREDSGEVLIGRIDDHKLRYIMARAADWVSVRNGEVKPCFPPGDVVRDVLASPEMPLPTLSRIITAPAFAADGTLPSQPGYHRSSQTYYAPAPGFDVPPVSDAPTATEITDARNLLAIELIGDFPFVGEAERAHALAALMLPFARNLISGPTPLHLFEKPSPGTGATLLVDILCYPFLGTKVGALSESRDDDECRKRITAALMTGSQTILFDNLHGRLDSAALASAITAPTWADRILGCSEMVRLPVACTWLATANNPQLSLEIARRTVRIRLDARQDQPWLRSNDQFRHPRLREWAEEYRAGLVWAALTLIRAWLVAGRPVGQRTLGMFEGWAEVMGGILDLAGIPGFLGNLDEFYAATDVESGVLRDFVRGWWVRFGSQVVTAASVWSLIGDHSALPLGEGNERSQKTRLGKLIAGMRDRVYRITVGGESREVRMTAAAISHSARQWQLVEGNMGNAGEPASATPQGQNVAIDSRVDGLQNVPQVPPRSPPSRRRIAHPLACAAPEQSGP